jgi:hypothetical protein
MPDARLLRYIILEGSALYLRGCAVEGAGLAL